MATKSGAGTSGRKPGPPKQSSSGAVASKQFSTRPTSGAGIAVLDNDGSEDTEPVESSALAQGGAGLTTPARKPWPVRLYLGEIGYDFIGKRKLWYTISAVLILICLASMIFRQFNLGVEFAGGERFRSPGSVNQLDDVTRAVEDQGAVVTSAQAVGDNQLVVITADLREEQSSDITQAIADALDVAPTDVANTTTSASWGQDVTSKALQGLLVFLALVLVFLIVRFQWKMAVGAMVALFHDLIITAGIYSLVGFEVTPASVIGFLTILGFSLYDTVVVFDKVDENTKGLLASQRRTYSETANLAINQVLMRSINTSVFALLPVLGLLYAGVFLIGEGTLQDLALVLFVGLLVGMYSSIFLAAPVLCDLKEREPEYRKLAKRLNAKRAGVALDKVDKAAPRTRRTGATSKAAQASDLPEPANDDVAAGTGALVASARRTRPRSTRSAGSTPEAKSATTATPTTTGTSAGETAPAGAGTTPPATQAGGNRLAPRPGAKPIRTGGARSASGKRKR